MCKPVIIYWRCCEYKESAFQVCEPGAITGNVGLACKYKHLHPKPLPTTDRDWENASQEQRIVMPAWCCSPSCCIRSIERDTLHTPKSADPDDKGDVGGWRRNAKWHIDQCLALYEEGLGRMAFSDIAPKVYLKTAPQPKSYEEFNHIVNKATGALRQNPTIAWSPYSHFVNVRNWLLVHPQHSHQSYEIPQQLVGPARHAFLRGQIWGHPFLRGRAAMSTFPRLPTPGIAPTAAFLKSLDATILDILMYTNIDLGLIQAKSSELDVLYVEATRQIAHWQWTGIGYLASTAIAKDNSGLAGDLSKAFLSGIVAREEKTRVATMVCKAVLDGWFNLQPVNEQARLSEWLNSLAPLEPAPLPVIAPIPGPA